MKTRAKLPQMSKSELASPALAVALGAPGGPEALGAFLRGVEAGLDAAYLVWPPAEVQTTAALCKEHCPLPLEVGAEGTLVKGDRVYVLPRGATVARHRGRLRITARKDDVNGSLDRLLADLAKSAGSASVGVLLAGGGEEGALGLSAIRQAGGWTLAARSAAGYFGVDAALEPAEMAAELKSYAVHLTAAFPEAVPDEVLEEICACLRETTGHSFKDYKRSTVGRRVLRRMRILRTAAPLDYLERLRRDGSEADELVRELLIGVTGFFRDPEAFGVLERRVLPELLRAAGPGGVRVWVPGTASGEEAYSLGMLLLEQSRGLAEPPSLQIFATDIDERALARARAGSYPLSIARQLSPERLDRFFTRRGNNYLVDRTLREICLFSRHNLATDPPFSRVDLISCRNLLIYLGPQLQKRVFPLFHYALRPGGYLFLGTAESVGMHEDLFRTVEARHRIYQRKAGPATAGVNLDSPARFSSPVGRFERVEGDQVGRLVRSTLLEQFAPAYAVVDEDRRVHSLSEGLSDYLALSEGQFQNDIVRLCRTGMRVALRAALAEAVRDGVRVTRENLRVGRGAKARGVRMTVCPLPALAGERLFVVVFEEQLVPDHPTPRDEDSDRLIEHLERELQDTRQDLERTIQELEAANEELKSSNEELLSINEELHSANEELETSKEELQARTDSLSRANSDVQNLLSSTQIATIFLDDQLNIRGFTPAATTIYNLIASDVGRPLSHITSRAESMPPLPAPSELEGRAAAECEIRLPEGRLFLRRLTPYRTEQGVSEGMVVTFTEVTALRESERQARERRDEIEAVYRTAPVGLALIDRNFRYLRVNEILARVHGLPVEEHIGRTLKEVLGDLADQMKPSLSEVMENGQAIYGLEYRAPTPAAPEVLRDWWISYFPMRDREGRLTAVNAVMQDQTERKWEERRRQAEHAVGQILNQGAGVRAALGAVMEALLANLEMKLAELWQLEGDRLVLSDVKSTLEGEHLESWIRQSRGYSFPRGVGLPGRAWADGELAWIHDLQVSREFRRQKTIESLQVKTAVGIPLISGEFHGVVALYTDRRLETDAALDESLLTVGADVARYLGRRRAEEALAISEERLQLAQEAGQMGTWDWNLANDMVHLNPRARRLLAMETEESTLPLEDTFANVHAEDQPPLRRALEDVAREGGHLAVEFRVQVDEDERWLIGRGAALRDQEGRAVRMVGLIFDVTERRRQEEALRRTSREKDEFLAMLAHELRNPLAPITHAVQILGAYPPDEDEVAEMYDIIARQSRYLARLVDDMLDVSRIARGQIPLVRRPEDLVELVRSTVRDYRSTFAEHDLELRAELPEGSVWVNVDAVRMGQVVGNLLHNAAKFTEPGGTVTVSLEATPGTAVLRVGDTGIGIEPTALRHVFEPFQQAAQSLDRGRGGLGLGLALVRGLVELHGGSIRARSEGVGQGAEFVIRLPLVEAPSEQAESQGKAPPLRVRILIVEDNRMVARTTARMLELAGHEVKTAPDGPAGLRLAAEWEPELILCDIGLPRMDGFAFAEALRRQESGGRPVRLVALSGYSDQVKRSHAMAAGFDDYVTKPLNQDRLVEVLSRLA